ncbi:uncharacterized protein [Littorina saxatilis]|uniref:uncharacterized protein n=1 Tax=Littorina saxatilis TaxID=31220 RepID=UPI0038B5E177
MSTPDRDRETAKRPAVSPLSDDGEAKRPCDSFMSDSDPETTIINPTYLNSTALDAPIQPPDMSNLKEQLKNALIDPELIELLSKALAVEVRKEIADLRVILAAKDKEIIQLREQFDDLEQYSRRNCIRISPIPELESENTDNIVKIVAKSIGVDLKDVDIDRSHRVGRKPAPGQPSQRPIIVKLTSYRSKVTLMMARRNLRDVDSSKLFPDASWPALPSRDARGARGAPKIFINDDLTKTRAAVASKARQLKVSKSLDDTWCRDGVVFVKKHNTVNRITTMRELEALV